MRINCPTSMTNPAAIAALLDVINQHGSLNSAEAKNTIFPRARATISRWNESKPDTHSVGHLYQYGLTEYIPGTNEEEFKLSFLGKRFLEIFEKKEGKINAAGEKEKDKYVCIEGMECAYNAVLIDCLLTWKLSIGGKVLHPGLLLLKLMVDHRLNGYIFEKEWAYVCDSDFADTLDYESLVDELVEYRELGQEPPVESAGNTYAFLIAFSNSWQIFEKEVVDGKNKFLLSEITKSNLKSKMLEIESLAREENGVISKNFNSEEGQPANTEPIYNVTVNNHGFETNRIIFGAPGTGKSFTLNKEKDELIAAGGFCERVTFHPEYSYANFVGTYKPVPYGNEITYSFVAGPFIRTWIEAMKSAQTDSPKPYVLLVEEINRANVAAVFGDVFQLLDRDENGVSEYPIQTSKELREYLAGELKCWPEQVATIKIPSNMFIWATMNSADQGVLPMDTAFKRRWDFKYIGINDNQDGIAGYIFEIAGQKIKWNALRNAINARLTSLNINEDKLIGPYFIKEKTLKDNKAFIEAFKSKVIMYLFEDAAKQRRGKVFFEDGKRYSELCDKFMLDGVKVFNEKIYEKLIDMEEAKQ